MKNKFFLFIILGLFLISFTSAYDLGTVKKDECVDLYQHCATCSYVNVTSIKYPNSSIVYINEEMNKNGYDFTYNFCLNNESGDYFYTVCGDPTADKEPCKTFTYLVTPNGKEIGLSNSIILFFVLFLIGAFLFFSINGVKKAESSSWLIGYICLTYVLIYAIIGIVYLIANNYLWAEPVIGNILYIIWFILGIGFLPFVMIVTLYILGQEARAVLEKNYLKQGYSREESKALSKKRK